MWVNFLGTFPKHISHVSTYFRNQYFFGCFIAQMIWLFNVQLSTCWAYWATASSSAYPQCARKWGYTEPEPSRGLSQQSKTQRWCRHQQLKSYWRRKYHEISHVLIILHRLRQRSVKNVKFSPSCHGHSLLLLYFMFCPPAIASEYETQMQEIFDAELHSMREK